MSSRISFIATTVASAAVIIGGCTVGPDYKAPTTRTAATWTEPAANGPTTQPITDTRWWTTFHDAELDGLVERAAKNNMDLRLAAARVREARALRRIAGADAWPTVNVGGSYTKGRNGFIGAAGGTGGSGGGVGGGAGGFAGSEFELYRAGFDATWELDVFGGVRRGVEAATADIDARIEARNATLVSLLAETALNYVQLRGLQERLNIALENIRVQRESLELTQTKFQAGLISDLDVSRSQALVSQTEAQVPQLEQQIRQTIHRIEVLVGEQPGVLVAQLSAAKPIPGIPPAVPVGLPSDLLRRRPDVRQAERNLAAATARVGVATADLFPRFSLTGSAGWQATDFSGLGTNRNAFYTIVPGVSWPIFDAGRIRANIAVANAQQDAAFVQWEQAVIQSLSDTEVALVAYTQEQTRYQRISDAVAANQRAVSTATELYERGLADFLNVLDAQRALFLTQESQAISRTTVSTNLVQLYKALGGGWEEPVAPTTQPVASSQ